MIPTKKISHTLLEFAEPCIRELPDGYSKNDLEAVLTLVVSVWNSCVLDQWNKSDVNVTLLRKTVSAGGSLHIAVTEAMIERKMRLFANDVRAISNQMVIERNGELIVRAEARIDLSKIDAEGLH